MYVVVSECPPQSESELKKKDVCLRLGQAKLQSQSCIVGVTDRQTLVEL